MLNVQLLVARDLDDACPQLRLPVLDTGVLPEVQHDEHSILPVLWDRIQDDHVLDVRGHDRDVLLGRLDHQPVTEEPQLLLPPGVQEEELVDNTARCSQIHGLGAVLTVLVDRPLSRVAKGLGDEADESSDLALLLGRDDDVP